MVGRKKHGSNAEHISLQSIMDYIYIHKLLVKAPEAHSGQTLSSEYIFYVSVLHSTNF